MAALSPTQKQALNWWGASGGATTDTLTPDQMAGMSPAQVGLLTPAQLANLTPELIFVWNELQVAGLAPSQITLFTSAQMMGLLKSGKVSTMTDDAKKAVVKRALLFQGTLETSGGSSISRATSLKVPGNVMTAIEFVSTSEEPFKVLRDEK